MKILDFDKQRKKLRKELPYGVQLTNAQNIARIKKEKVKTTGELEGERK